MEYKNQKFQKYNSNLSKKTTEKREPTLAFSKTKRKRSDKTQTVSSEEGLRGLALRE